MYAGDMEGDDFSQFMLQGYNCIPQGKSSSSKRGLVIYIDDTYKADVINNLNLYEHWEGLIIKVNGGNLAKYFQRQPWVPQRVTEGPRRPIINLDAWEETPSQYLGFNPTLYFKKR